jgi:hypothetical protein
MLRIISISSLIVATIALIYAFNQKKTGNHILRLIEITLEKVKKLQIPCKHTESD